MKNPGPSGWWYAVAGVLFVVGLVGAGLYIFSGVQGVIDDIDAMPRTNVNSGESVQLELSLIHI